MLDLFRDGKALTFKLDLSVQSLTENIETVLEQQPEGKEKEAWRVILKALFPLFDKKMATRLGDYDFEVNVFQVPLRNELAFRLLTSVCATKEFFSGGVKFEEIIETVSIRTKLEMEPTNKPEVKRPIFSVVK